MNFTISPGLICLVTSGVVALGIALDTVVVNAEDNPPTSSRTTHQPDPVRGRETFMAVGCYACHGTVGQGAPGAGPKLAPDALPLPALLALIRNPPNVMPPYSQRVLSDESVADIHAYLASISAAP